MKFISRLAFALFVFIFLLPSCRKDKFTSTGNLNLSTDTLTFDTIFTTLGSTTKFFTIRNNSKQTLKISNIQLSGGAASPYRINVDGDAGNSFNDVEIPAKDSLYVFVEVTVDPNAANLPFLIMDSIRFTTNGHPQQVILQTYGQNAHFYNADSIENNTIWNNDLPYVILNYLEVREGASLTINSGCSVYFGGGAALIVEGDLQVKGTDTLHMVTFRGVRNDQDIAGRPYDDFPGQYAGVFFLRNSTGNIEYLNMRNSSYGINVGNIKTTDDPVQNTNALLAMSSSNWPVVTLRNTRIYNNAFYGIFGFLGKITGENLLVYNCGKNVVGLYDGGDYHFTNCTFYTRGGAYLSHSKDPAFYMSNYFTYSATAAPVTADTSRAELVNCILYGTLEEEIIAEDATIGLHKTSLTFDHCIVKTRAAVPSAVFPSSKKDDPQFFDVFRSNYKPKAASPAKDSGDPLRTPSDDVDGNMRTGADIGAFEIP
jgi:hypothetical protein